MVEKNVQIMNEMGLHARPSAKFVKLASSFPCNIELTKDGLTINGKSILGVMSLAAERGSTITIVADGEKESEAISALTELIHGFVDEEKEIQDN